MNAPVGTGFKIATDSLINEAQRWEEQAAKMSDAGRRADHLRFNSDEDGIYARFFMPSYRAFVDAYMARCREANDRMQEIRNTLVKIARSYEDEEEANAKRITDAASQPK